jgi:hypothetical protein
VIVWRGARHYLGMRVSALLVAVVTLSIPHPAKAGAAVRLAYDAPDDCPSRTDFSAAVATRGADFDAGQATGSGPTMVVSIRRQGEAFAGAFQLRDEHSTTNQREVRGQDCREVVDALAVVAAIALHAEVPASSSGAVPADPQPAPAVPVVRPLPPDNDDRSRGKTLAFPPRVETLQVRAGTLRFDLRRSATLSAGATLGMVPGVLLPRYDLSLVTAHFLTMPEGTQRISGLVFRLRVGALGPGTYTSPDTKTEASGLSFGLDLCQSPHYDTKGLVLLFCGGYGGGLMMLKTNGPDGAQIQSKNSGFGEVTFSAEAQLHLGGGFHLALRLGGGLTIGDITAERADGSRIFRSSLWNGSVLLGAGVRF